jgi:predicted amidophosphoribosyltransferase
LLVRRSLGEGGGLAAWAKTCANSVLASLFEPPCAACRATLARPLDGAVCEGCWSSVGTATPIQLRFEAAHPIAWAMAIDAYDGRMKDIIHALKYDRRRTISPRLGDLMRERGAALLDGADCVVPVPLHPRRVYTRGFNQAHDLAIHLGPPVVSLLKRVVFTRSQIDLPRHERHENVREAFAIDTPKGVSPLGFPKDSCGDGPLGPSIKIVVLVDDVCTTGATLESCARVLKIAGVREVRALTAARVVSARR